MIAFSIGGPGHGASALPLPAAKSAAERSRPVVLLVEDDPRDLQLYATTLWYNGFDIVTAEDGEAAVDLAREWQPDLVLLDLLLPKLTGLEACKRMREAGLDLPVVALTGRSQLEFGGRARAAGCTDYLEKPISPLRVLHFVEELIGRPPPPGEDADRSGAGDPA